MEKKNKFYFTWKKKPLNIYYDLGNVLCFIHLCM